MKKTFVVSLLFCALLACNNILKKPAFNVTAPVGWTRKDTLNRESDSVVRLASPIYLPGEDIRESISLFIETKFSPNDPEQDLLKKDLKNRADRYEEAGSGHRMIDGVEAYWFQVAIKFKSKDIACTQRYYFVPSQSVRYMFICTCPEKGFEHLRSFADSVLNSFKILN